MLAYVFDQWVKFVEVMRDPHSWSKGAGYVYVCSDYFTPKRDYENFTNLKYGYQTIPKLNKEQCHPRDLFQHQVSWRKTARNLLKAKVNSGHMSTNPAQSKGRPLPILKKNQHY